jgi:hypothetical protein
MSSNQLKSACMSCGFGADQLRTGLISFIFVTIQLILSSFSVSTSVIIPERDSMVLVIIS